MKKYEKPEMQVIQVLVSDVLTASTDGLTNGGTGTGIDDDVNFGDLL